MAIDALLLGGNLLTGALVGYLTNSLAIRMLFREYPLIGGGDIVKNREALEDAMSALVEERLITPRTLLEEFDTPEFKASFESLLRYIIAHNLKAQVLRLETPGDLRGYQQTLANLKHYLRQQREPILNAALQTLIEHVELTEVFSPDQQEEVLERLWQMLLRLLAHNQERMAEELHQLLEDLPCEALLDDTLLESLLDSLSENLDQTLRSSGLLDTLDQLESLLALPELLARLEAHLRTLTLSELLGEVPSRNIAQNLALRLLDVLNTSQGERLLEELLRHGVQVLKKLELPLAMLLNQKLERQLLQLLERYLPDALVLLENWAAQNRLELEELVRSAINEHLRSENLVKHLTATLFTEQITERYRIIENILEEIKVIAGQSMPELIEMTNRFLARTSIGQVLTYAERHLIDYPALTRTLLRLLNTYLPRLDLSILDPVFSRPLHSFSVLKDLHLPPLWQRFLYPYLRQQVETRLLPALPRLARRWGLDLWQQLKGRSLGSLLLRDSGDGPRLSHELLQRLHHPALKQLILQQVLQRLPEWLANRQIAELLPPPTRELLRQKLGHVYEMRLNQFLDSFQQERIDKLYSQLVDVFFTLSENQQIAAQLREVLVGFLIELIRDHNLFDGRIALTVKESFVRFSDAEMQAEMEGFMGKELQPITLFGAVLGGGVGLALSGLMLLPGSQAVSQIWLLGLPALFSYPLVYALTGIGTNWLAIKMLFKPHYARYWPLLRKPLPFTPGVFIKNKAALADSMSRFIDQKLLSKQNMVSILERYHQRWKEVIKGVLSQNDYAAWDQRFRTATRDNYDVVVPLLLELSFEQIYRYRDEIVAAALAEVHQLSLSAEDQSLLRQALLQALQGSEVQLRRWINRRLEDWRQHNYPLSDQLSPALLDALYAQSDRLIETQLSHWTRHLQARPHWDQLLQTLLLRWDGHLDLQLEQITPGQSLPKTQLVHYLLDWVKSEALQQELHDLLQRYLGEILRGQQTLGSLWEGQLLNLIRQESDGLIDILASYILEMARQNKARIAKSVLSDVQKQGLLEVMLVNFGGVRQDVRRVVDVVIDDQLEPYLASKTEGLKQWWHQLSETHLPQLALAELGLDPELFEVATLQAIVREHVLESPQTVELLSDLMDGFVDELLQQLDLKALLQSLGLHSLREGLQRFDTELGLIHHHLRQQLLSEQAAICLALQAQARQVLALHCLERPPGDWLGEIPSYRLKQVPARLLQILYASSLSQKVLPELLDQALAPLQHGKLSSWLNYRILESDMAQVLEQLTLAQTPRSQAFQQTIHLALKDITIGFVDVLNTHLQQDTKEDLENLAVDSLIDGLRINNREVLEPIDFEAIVKREVLRMPPERIEALFDFAQPIFRALIWYGALGGVMGLVVGMLAALG
ncbi:MAG: DUF445 family protein [Candidatus Sericytochromatia bacterium]|nr:DUF445 family protein [Candidatus Sericytochromatia bacterium]